MDGNSVANGDVDLFACLDVDGSNPSRPPPTRAARFQPKMKGKIKAEPSSSSSSAAVAPPPPASEPPKNRPDDEEGTTDLPVAPPDVVKTEDVEMESEVKPMEIDGGDGGVDEEFEDSVEREIDVFFNPGPLDDGASIYVTQYPLRPYWRPYELNERCEEVRMKPKELKLEIDLAVDAHSEHYDTDVDMSLQIKNQTLLSSRAPFVTNYAVGVLSNNKLHLHPINAIFQLRPSMEYITGGKKKHSEQLSASTKTKSNVEDSDSKLGKMVSTSTNEVIQDAESWIPLQYHAYDSPISDRYHTKMVAQTNDVLPFKMQISDYLNSLCPGTSTSYKVRKGPPTRILLAMPLEERLQKWFSEVSQVNRFDALMHLAPDSSEEDVLKIIQKFALLVQGLWVSRTPFLSYVNDMAVVRDHILCLFHKKQNFKFEDKLKNEKVSYKDLKPMLEEIAYFRSEFRDWKFKEATDVSFMKRYPQIVKEQEDRWPKFEENVSKYFEKLFKKKPTPKPRDQASKVANRADGNAVRIKDLPAASAMTSMSKETREHLPAVISKIFLDKGVFSLGAVKRELQALAISNSSRPRDDPKTKALINLARSGASATAPELESVVNQIAIDIHGVYALKSTGNTVLDPLRHIIIDLFRGKAAKATISKQEVFVAANLTLKREISDSEYNQVIRQLCDSKSKGLWELKSAE